MFAIDPGTAATRERGNAPRGGRETTGYEPAYALASLSQECHLLLELAASSSRDWYFIAEQPAPAPHLAHPEGCAALRIVLVTVPRVSRACGHFPGVATTGLCRRLFVVREACDADRVSRPVTDVSSGRKQSKLGS